MIQEKALEYGKELGITDFVASNGWLSRFKARQNLCGKSISGEEGAVDSRPTEQWKAEILPSLIDGYRDEDIYNTDETGLFYELLPNKTSFQRGKMRRWKTIQKLDIRSSRQQKRLGQIETARHRKVKKSSLF